MPRIVDALRPLTRRLPPGVKRRLRRVAGGWQVDAQATTDAADIPAPLLAFADFSFYLHALRTAQLQTLPAAEHTLLSAGPSSVGYFEWLEAHSHRVSRHIGIEAYQPAPDELPANVEWIQKSISDMSAIATASVDVMFSGQNFEHLWVDEVADSLIDAHRVIRPGGHLVMDSPNRLITERNLWSHPQHTVEYTPDEVRHILDLAGFDTTDLVGLHLCSHLITGALLPLDPVNDDNATVAARIALAGQHPDQSFVWWVTARRSDRQPDPQAVRSFAQAVFDVAWPERLGRVIMADDVEWVDLPEGLKIGKVPRGHHGLVMYGPYFPLRPGRYLAEAEVRFESPLETGPLTIKVVADFGARVLGEHTAHTPGHAGWHRVGLEFTTDTTMFASEVRLYSSSGVAFDVQRAAFITPRS